MAGRRRPAPPPALALASAALLAAACAGGRASTEAGEGSGPAVVDTVPMPAGEEGAFEDLPGIPRLDELAAELHAQVIDRSNGTRCPCGCPRHSVAHCIHQREACDVAVRLASAFVEDALAVQRRLPRLAGGPVAPAAAEPASVDTPGEVDVSEDTPDDEEATEPDDEETLDQDADAETPAETGPSAEETSP